MFRTAAHLVVFLALINPVITRGQKGYQPDEKYLRLSARAMVYFQEQKYQQAALVYDSLFTASKGQGLTTEFIVSAICWAKTGNKDKAFASLRKGLATYGIVNIRDLNSDPDFKSLQGDKRWQQLIDEVTARNKVLEAKLNRPVMTQLDSIYVKDQADREKLDSVQQKFGFQSKEVGALWKKIMKQDSANLVAVKGIIDKYGWLGPEEVGERGSTAIFLVIQHADHQTQITYLPVMREAVKNGKAKARDLALLEDRVLTNQGKEQIYGSQIHSDSLGRMSFYPIMDEENVNKRRTSVGLGPLEDYARMFGIEYKVPSKKAQKR